MSISRLALFAAMVLGTVTTDRAFGSSVTDSCIILDLNDMVANPPPAEIDASIECEQSVWCQFLPNLTKLILSGAADTQHIAILWYPVSGGRVDLHHHFQTESVYTIAGSQTDAEGVYPTGTVRFHPSGSGHSIWDSNGFFLLTYAAPPDFGNADLIEPHTSVIIDTTPENGNITETTDLLVEQEENHGHQSVVHHRVPLDSSGGMTATFIDVLDHGSSSSTTILPAAAAYDGNYVLVLGGSCIIGGEIFVEQMLIVAKEIETQSFEISNQDGNDCKVLVVSFVTPEVDDSSSEEESVVSGDSNKLCVGQVGSLASLLQWMQPWRCIDKDKQL